MKNFNCIGLVRVCCVFVALFSSAVFATKTAEYELNKLNELLTNLDTFKAEFKQKIYAENGEKVDEVSGEIAIKKPGRFYWNVTDPFEQKLIADGKYLWQYDVDLEQATVRNLDESLGSTPAEILSGKVTNIEKQYHINFTTEKGIESFKLIPTDEGQFEYIILNFEAGALVGLILKDTLAQTTNVSFKNAQFGLALPDQLFLINLPKGIDIVDSRTQSDLPENFSTVVENHENSREENETQASLKNKKTGQ